MPEENVVQEKEINEVLGDFIPAQEAVASETEVVEEKPVEVKEDEQKGEERPEEKAGEQKPDGKPAEEEKPEEVKQPVVEEKAAVVEEKPAQEDELQKARRELAETRAHLEELAGRVVAPPQVQKTEEQVKKEQEQAAARARAPLKFLPNDAAFDEVMKTADNFNQLLTAVVNYTAERVLRMVPQVATSYVDQQLTYKTAAQDFYRENEDLIPHMKYVGYVSNELLAQHTDWDLPTLLKETEKEVRTRLKLGKVVQAQVGTGQQIGTGVTRTVASNPGFVPGSGGGGRRGSVSSPLTGVEKDVMDLIS